MTWNNHGSWESDIPWQLHSQKATLCEALLKLQLQTFLLLNIHLSLWAIQLIFIALSVSVIRDQLLVELITIIGSYEMMKKFVNTQKNGGTWWPWRITNPFLTSIALVIWSPWRHTASPLPEVDDLIDPLGSRTVFPACELHQSKSHILVMDQHEDRWGMTSGPQQPLRPLLRKISGFWPQCHRPLGHYSP